jgi:hypothetical protein
MAIDIRSGKGIDIVGYNDTPITALFVPKGSLYITGMDEGQPDMYGPVDRNTVVFYDGRYKHTPLGQYISSYYVETLLEGGSSPFRGLDLMGDAPDWKLLPDALTLVIDWLKYLESLES